MGRQTVNKSQLAKHCSVGVALLLLVGCAREANQPLDLLEADSVARTRLLTSEQYTNSISQIFGEDIGNSLLTPMPPMQRVGGLLSSGAAFAGVTSDQTSQIQQSAASVAEKVVDEFHRDYLIPCRPQRSTASDPSCAEQFLKDTGRLVYRRPLTDIQLAELVAIADYATQQTGDFYEGLALSLEAMLISPAFIFVVDRAEPHPDKPGIQRLDSYSLASRLSFFLWNGPPDDALLLAAQTHALQSPQGLAKAVDRLLASSRIEAGMRAFFDDMLGFDNFNSLAKDPAVYPMITATTLENAREQTLRTIVDHLLVQQADYRDLFTTRKTFMSPSLAVAYGTPSAKGWVAHEFPEDSPRIGLLTHLSFLAANSHSVRSSPTLRGQALREEFLCQVVPSPPPNVDFSSLEEDEHALTARDRLAAHNSNPSCAGCHLITDPIGLALENFDGAGLFREAENGVELDISGELDGVTYQSIEGLAVALRNHPKLSACLVGRLYAYSTGGPLSLKDDQATLAWLEDRFVANQYRLPATLKALTLSSAFSTVRSASSDEDTDSLNRGDWRMDDAPARISEEQLSLSTLQRFGSLESQL